MDNLRLALENSVLGGSWMVEVKSKFDILNDDDDGFMKVKDEEMGTKINAMPLPFSHGHHFQE